MMKLQIKPERKRRVLVASLQTAEVLETQETKHHGRRVMLLHVRCADCPETFWRPAPALRAAEGHKDPIRCDECRKKQKRLNKSKNKGKPKALTPLAQVLARIRELPQQDQAAIEKLFRAHVQTIEKYDGKYDPRNAVIFLADAIELIRVENRPSDVPPLAAMKSPTSGNFQQFSQYVTPRDSHFS